MILNFFRKKGSVSFLRISISNFWPKISKILRAVIQIWRWLTNKVTFPGLSSTEVENCNVPQGTSLTNEKVSDTSFFSSSNLEFHHCTSFYHFQSCMSYNNHWYHNQQNQAHLRSQNRRMQENKILSFFFCIIGIVFPNLALKPGNHWLSSGVEPLVPS